MAMKRHTCLLERSPFWGEMRSVVPDLMEMALDSADNRDIVDGILQKEEE